MKVVIAPDSFGGTLSARGAAAAIAAGWRRVRPQDEVVTVPLSDGGEGLINVVARDGDRWQHTEVAGPLGHPVDAAWLLRGDTAIIESARACGLALVPDEQRDPLRTTTYGVGQVLAAAHAAGARHVLLGLGGSATVDGGSGALNGLGFRVTVADGSGLKIGAEDLDRVTRVEPVWTPDLGDLRVTLLTDVSTVLADAAAVFGPQKGAAPADIGRLAAALEVWADVAERDLAGGTSHRWTPGSGAAGGLGFALACALGAAYEPGAERVAALVGLDAALRDAELVVTGEGRLDATSGAGKVVGAVRDRGVAARVPVAAVVGQRTDDALQLDHVEVAAPAGPGSDPAAEVAAAAARMAGRWAARR